VIADADADTRALYCEHLSALPLDIVEVDDGRDALVQCLTRPPSLLITELRLPVIDGFALCEVLRGDPIAEAIPILIVTSESRPAELLRLRRLRATTILSKPVAMEVVVAEAERLCRTPHTLACTLDSSTLERDAGPSSPSQRTASRSFRRFNTATPPQKPRPLRCPSCDDRLDYVKSRIGGVSQREAEQWDQLQCPGRCGVFEYRHRTRTLRLIS
jgi:CheY-like chemotaxis protein